VPVAAAADAGATRVRPVAAWWRHGEHRLRLDGLSAPVAVRAKVGLVVIAAAAAAVLLVGMGVALPAGVVSSSSWDQPVPRLLIAFAFIAFAVAQWLVAALALRSRGWARRLELVLVAVLNAALGSGLVVVADSIEELRRTTTLLLRTPHGLIPTVPYEGAATTPLAIVGWGIVAAALVLPFLPARATRHRLVEVLAVAPPLVVLGVFAATDRTRVPTEHVADGWSESVQTAVGFALLNVLIAAGLCVSVVFLWQAAAAATAARDVGKGLAAIGNHVPRLAGALVTLKLAWVALGYANHLPAELGGESGVWDASRSNGWLAWGIAATFAGAVGYALVVGSRWNVSERDFGAVRRLLVAGFVAPWVLAAAAALAALALAVRPSLREPFESLSLWAAGHGVWSGVVTVAAALAASIVALATRRRHAWGAVALFLLAFSVWALPRTIAIVADSRTPTDVASVDLVTFDSAVSVALAGLVLGGWVRVRRGRPASPDGTTLLVVLGASTAVCYSGLLFDASPSAVKGLAFSLALVFPAVYLLVADAGALNRPSHDRERRVLAAIAAIAGLLTVIAVLVALGELEGGKATFGDVGRVVFVLPLAAVLVAATLRPSREASPA
jgi:hypothetical protein